MMTPKPIEVIGFDLGHGETAVARISLSSKAMPEILEIGHRRSQITAIGHLPSKGVFVGEKALRIDGIVDAKVGFKVRPPVPPDCAQALREFMTEYNRYLIDSNKISGGTNSHYFVGCPSGWSQAEVDEYLSILRSSGIPLLDVVRESRAALLHAKETGRLTATQLSSSVLVLDLGSSTLDATHIIGGIRDEKLDSGLGLGGCLIDREILRRAIKRADLEVQTFLMSPEGRTLRTRAEVVCRQKKEEFWINEEEYCEKPVPGGFPVNGHYVEIYLDGQEMDDIINSPLPELRGKSWKAAFLDAMRGLQSQFDSSGAAPQVLVLTGGASRMSFVPVLCKQAFPTTTLIHCSPPEETVAFGLAHWGFISLQTSSFSEDVTAFCKAELTEIIALHSEGLCASLCETTAKGVVSDVVGPALKAWRAGEIQTLNELESSLLDRINSWLNSSTGLNTTRASYREILLKIAADVDRKTFPICTAHGIPPNSLQLDLQSEGPDSASINLFQGTLMIAGTISLALMMIFNFIARSFIGGIGGVAGSGPPGWLVLGLISSLGAVMGVGVLTESLKDLCIPIFLRDMALPDRKIEKITEQLRTEIIDSFKRDFREKHLPQVSATIAEQTVRQLDAKVEQVKWIISK